MEMVCSDRRAEEYQRRDEKGRRCECCKEEREESRLFVCQHIYRGGDMFRLFHIPQWFH